VWPGKFTEVYSPAHSDFRPSHCGEPELWFGFEIEFATSDSEACDRVVIGIRRWSDQVRWSFGVVYTIIVRDGGELPIDGPVSRLVS